MDETYSMMQTYAPMEDSVSIYSAAKYVSYVLVVLQLT